MLALLVSLVGIVGLRLSVLAFFPVSPFRRRVLVMGSGKSAASLLNVERELSKSGCFIVGFVHVPGNAPLVPEVRLISVDRPLLQFVFENRVDEIVVALEERRGCVPLDELAECRDAGIFVSALREFWERQLGHLRLDLVSPGYLIFDEEFQRKAVYESVKRGFDVVFSLILLTIISPVFLLTAVAILWESGGKGPVIYRQVRVGLRGRNFEMLKFRSMRTDAEPDRKARWAQDNDPRITRVGAFIRKHRIDELPQLFNVLRGDMTFVGPRPERPEFVDNLKEKVPFYRHRHAVKVGLSGWAQLCYPYGSSEQDAAQKLQYDLYYIKNQSAFLDLLILLQTIEVVLLGRGAK